MDSALCANGFELQGTISSNFLPICVLPKGDSPIVPIGPVTPDSNRATAGSILDISCQVMLVSSPPSVPCVDLNDDGSQTPKGSIFDLFAPVNDKFMLASRLGKGVEESRNNIVRRINFSSTTNLVSSRNQEAYNHTISEDERLFDIVYSDLLDVITSERTKEFASKSRAQVSDSDGFCTPKFAACFDGITVTCPGAPKKSISKYRNIDKKLCRKLEF